MAADRLRRAKQVDEKGNLGKGTLIRRKGPVGLQPGALSPYSCVAIRFLATTRERK